MDNKGYYKTLGVSETASEDEIKKAYRSGAIKWHPDRWVNGTEEEKKTAEDNFKNLNEAYSVLSDKDKRQAYDMGMDGGPQAGGPGFNPFDIFKQHFGGNGFGFNFGDFFGGGFEGQQYETPQPINKGQNINVVVNITMEEANNGVSKPITISTHEKCEFCDGTGFGKDGGEENCPQCGGVGKVKQVQRVGFATVATQFTCPHCGGTGKIIKNPCTHCGGTGLSGEKMKDETITVNIPVGVAPGETVCFKNRGDYPVRGKGVRGDLNITVNIDMPEGYNFVNNFGGVEYEMDVPFYDAILGCQREVKFPSGKVQKIKIEKNTKPGTVYSYKGEGMKLKDGRARSSFDVVVNYVIPEKLTKKQEEILKEFKNTLENGN